ncbi:radical SAM/CxCxxxxC motif protein YfkAB [Pasteuria penetrans]|uniref:radical SAM/CxCxxxxC motif protein YfkAB n=1 Tax=Pasteuria penetrans TaxID=86005 RepID=UPI000FA7CB01|nr:radical SAM/CxCxxxxC motif protein YfkAB [Pasteuria penetrans]
MHWTHNCGIDSESPPRDCRSELDPWDPLPVRLSEGRYVLTSVEITVTQLCNLRCAHCAVGESLSVHEQPALPLEDLLRALDGVDSLTTLSLTGGEPCASPRTVEQWVRPLLRYARERGLSTQINTNLTLPSSRYEASWLSDVDILHISYNAWDVDSFFRMAFAHAPQGTMVAAARFWDRLHGNARTLSSAGAFLSAETFISPLTSPHLEALHRGVADLGCSRHEIHPLYPSDFARGEDLLDISAYRGAVERLLSVRDPRVWMLFGTLPIFPCSEEMADRELWVRLHHTPGVTVRQDPDGRNRLNLNPFDGKVRLTDFGQASGSVLGDWREEGLPSIFQRWLASKEANSCHCFCPLVRCSGPNHLVLEAYYRGWDFQQRKANFSLLGSGGCSIQKGDG